MPTAYLASTDFPRNRSIVERPISITLPSSRATTTATTGATSGLATTSDFNNSVTRIVDAISSDPTASSSSATTPTSTALSTTRTPSATTPSALSSDNQVLSLLRNSMGTIEQAASTILTQPSAPRPSTVAPTSTSTGTTATVPSLSITSADSPARGLAAGTLTPTVLPTGSAFTTQTSMRPVPSLTGSWDTQPLVITPSATPVTVPIATPVSMTSTPLTQTLSDIYTASPLTPDVLVVDTPVIADVYYPVDITSPTTDLASIMAQDPLIVWA